MEYTPEFIEQLRGVEAKYRMLIRETISHDQMWAEVESWQDAPKPKPSRRRRSTKAKKPA